MVNPAAAQGLDINDSGSPMLYENGRAVKSESRTVNGITYTFDANGEAVSPSAKKTGDYKVQKGDNLWLIAKKYSCTVADLEQLNGISRSDIIYTGQMLKVPS